MIRELNRACEKLNKTLGVSVSLPQPEGKALRSASVHSFAFGAVLLAAGMVFASKPCAALGGLSVVNGAVLRAESGKK